MKLSLRNALLLNLVLIFFTGAEVASEGRPTFQIAPFGGFRSSGSVGLDDPQYSKLDITNGSVLGLGVGVEVPDGLVEIQWSHHDAALEAIPAVGSGAAPESLDLKTDQIHLNGLYFPPGFEGLLPYVLAGVGATIYSPEGASQSMSRFSWALGGGAKVVLSERLSLRLEGKWNPAVISSSGGVFCNSGTGRCFVTASGELINQFDFTLGVSIRL